MATFKFVIGDPKTKKTYQVEKDQGEVMGLVGKKIGDKFNGDLIGLSGYEILITGGTDKDGFPMHPDVHGTVKKRIILSNPPGFRSKHKGMRKRKMIVGNTLTRNIAQINCKIIKKGSKSVDELLGKKSTEQKESGEEKPEEKTEQKKPEEKSKEKKEKKLEEEKPEEKKPKEESKKDEKKPEKKPEKKDKKTEKKEEKPKSDSKKKPKEGKK